jgi:hypothetical protein
MVMRNLSFSQKCSLFSLLSTVSCPLPKSKNVKKLTCWGKRSSSKQIKIGWLELAKSRFMLLGNRFVFLLVAHFNFRDIVLLRLVYRNRVFNKEA